jgi:hypothetical protein
VLGFRLPRFFSTGVSKGSFRNPAPSVGGAYNDPRMECAGGCSETIQAGRSQSTVRAVLAGASAAGIGAGVLLRLIAPAHSSKSYQTPTFGVGVALQKFSTSAVWQF